MENVTPNSDIEIVITGASRGIGFELMKLCASHQHKVLGVARNLPAEMGDWEFVNGDITETETLVAAIKKMHGASHARLRVLVHNAGQVINSSFEDITDAQLQQLWEVNFRAPFTLTRSLISWLKAADAAHVIYIGSMGGFQGSVRYSGLSAYSAVKSAGASLMESLAVEYAETGIRFNALALGAVQTEMLEESIPDFNASLKPGDMAQYIYTFMMEGYKVMNGVVMPVRCGNP
ncbi:MAG: SDR family oxidoreductase [Bacteroidia bacterium]|jgi:3-oxoacyl-[acyl-carrier protein] reductase